MDEDKLELWEIKQFGDKYVSHYIRKTSNLLISLNYRQEKINAIQPVTRTTTGKLPAQRPQHVDTSSTTTQASTVGGSSTSHANIGGNKVVVSSKATPEEIKEKMEQQLRIQRAAHHHKRALEMQKQGKLLLSKVQFYF